MARCTPAGRKHVGNHLRERAGHPTRLLRRHPRARRGVGDREAAKEALPATVASLVRQPRHRGPRHGRCAAALSPGAGRSRGARRSQGWGLLNLVALPFWLAIAVSLVVLDLVIYAQHVLFHAVPALWRLHRMHHADLDVDVTTGSRFHPVEIVLSVSSRWPPCSRSARRGGGGRVRHRAERHVHVQPRQRAPRARRRPGAALARRDAGHAPGSPFRPPAETNSNFGFTCRGGTASSAPTGAAEARARDDDDRPRRLPGAGRLHLHRMLLQPLRRGAVDYWTDRANERGPHRRADGGA